MGAVNNGHHAVKPQADIPWATEAGKSYVLLIQKVKVTQKLCGLFGSTNLFYAREFLLIYCGISIAFK
jgi:homoserine trans-succinylase